MGKTLCFYAEGLVAWRKVFWADSKSKQPEQERYVLGKARGLARALASSWADG